jgi:serine/threonine protein kinase
LIYYLKKAVPEMAEESQLLDLVEKMLRLNPQSRYSAEECLEHDFFKVSYEQEPLMPPGIVEKKQRNEKGEDYVSKKHKYM